MSGRSADLTIQELLEFRCVRPLRTVHQLLQDAHGLALLSGVPRLQSTSCHEVRLGLPAERDRVARLHWRHVQEPRTPKCGLKSQYAVSPDVHMP